VIVQQHLATLGNAWQRKDAVDGSARDGARREQLARLIDRCDKGDFVATC
jgi:hypothetical protein